MADTWAGNTYNQCVSFKALQNGITTGGFQGSSYSALPDTRELVTVADTNTLAISPSGKNVTTNNSGIAVTLMDIFNMEIIKNYPAKGLDPFYNYGFYRDFTDINLQLTKSYITILNNTALAANESVILNIFYYLKNKK